MQFNMCEADSSSSSSSRSCGKLKNFEYVPGACMCGKYMADYVRAYGGISLLGGLSALPVYINQANGFLSLIEMGKEKLKTEE